MLIGHGYDIHRLVSGRKLIIGGVDIPHKKGLLGHTDADVLVHAIIDALLGACGLGDIGKHFPDSDPKWKDVNSLDLLRSTFIMIKNKKHSIINIDSTIVAEEPKLAPYMQKMRENIATVLQVKDISRINIKAKTNEEQDSVGKKDAICVWAVALLE